MRPESFRPVPGAAAQEDYIPSPRQAAMGYFGRNVAGNLRTHCVTCLDSHPLTGDAPGLVPARCYGGYPGDSGLEERCDICGVTMGELSALCQREHDEQQARWARQPVTCLVEYGGTYGVRCRVY